MSKKTPGTYRSRRSYMMPPIPLGSNPGIHSTNLRKKTSMPKRPGEKNGRITFQEEETSLRTQPNAYPASLQTAENNGWRQIELGQDTAEQRQINTDGDRSTPPCAQNVTKPPRTQTIWSFTAQSLGWREDTQQPISRKRSSSTG